MYLGMKSSKEISHVSTLHSHCLFICYESFKSYLFTYLLTYLLHGAGYSLKS